MVGKRVQVGGDRIPSRAKLRPVALKTSDTRRELAHEVNCYMLADNGELLLEAEEMDFIAIGFNPTRPAMRMPTLLTRRSVGERDGGGEQIFDRNTHACSRP